jgi:hypothetical protein
MANIKTNLDIRHILKKIFLEEIQGHKRTICIICGFKTNIDQEPYVDIRILRAFGTCVCSYCVRKTINGRGYKKDGVQRHYL